jgi:AraC-like DNA-binding protein
MITRFEQIELKDDYSVSKLPLTAMDAMHFHDCMELALLTGGGAVYTVESRDYPMRAGDAIIINNTEAHRVSQVSADAEQMLFIFNPSFVATNFNSVDFEYLSAFVSRNQSFENLVEAGSPLAAEIKTLLTEIYAEHLEKKCGYTQMIKAKLLILLTDIYRECSLKQTISKNRRCLNTLLPVFDYLEKNYQNKITLSGAAALCGYTPQYFCSFFKRTTGVSFISYLLNIRLAKSAELLKDPSLSIREAGEYAGFENNSNFINQFKRRFCKTPSGYRQAFGR